VPTFSDGEAEQLAQSKPQLRKLLFGSPAVQDIARRRFFAAVLARSIPEGTGPQTEVDLINAWWKRAGHDAVPDTVLQRQRALINFARTFVPSELGSVTSLSGLKNDSRFIQIQAPLQPGNSGGRLLDMSGNVIGVVADRLDVASRSIGPNSGEQF
jgi:hypothetical protein